MSAKLVAVEESDAVGKVRFVPRLDFSQHFSFLEDERSVGVIDLDSNDLFCFAIQRLYHLEKDIWKN